MINLKRNKYISVFGGTLFAMFLAYYVVSALLGNVSMRYCGRVINEEGRGIAGVVIKGEYTSIDLINIVVFTLPVERVKTRTPFTVVSDANGEFDVSVRSGIAIDITKVEKDGLEMVPRQKSLDRNYSLRNGGRDASFPDTAESRLNIHMQRIRNRIMIP